MELLSLFDPTHVESWLVAGGYLVLFGLLFGCGLGMPLPEDIPLLVSGFLVSRGRMHLLPAAIVAWCGIIGGDCVLYHFGKKYGLNITRVPFIGKHVTRKRIERAERLFTAYGVWVVGVGRLFAGVRGAMVVAAGAIRFNFVKFIIADGLAAIVSGGLFVGLGYWGGRTIGDPGAIIEQIAPYKFIAMSALAAIVMAVIGYIWWRNKRHKLLADVVIETAEHITDGALHPRGHDGRDEDKPEGAVDPSK